MKKHVINGKIILLIIVAVLLFHSCSKQDITIRNANAEEYSIVEHKKEQIEKSGLSLGESLADFKNQESIKALITLYSFLSSPNNNEYATEIYSVANELKCIIYMMQNNTDSLPYVLNSLLMSKLETDQKDAVGLYKWDIEKKKWYYSDTSRLIFEYPYFYKSQCRRATYEIDPLKQKNNEESDYALTSVLNSEGKKLAEVFLSSKLDETQQNSLLNCAITSENYKNEFTACETKGDISFKSLLKKNGLVLQYNVINFEDKRMQFSINDLTFEISEKYLPDTIEAKFRKIDPADKEEYISFLNENFSVNISNAEGEKFAVGSFYIFEGYIDVWDLNLTSTDPYYSQTILQQTKDLYALRFIFEDDSKIDLSSYLPIEYNNFISDILQLYISIVSNSDETEKILLNTKELMSSMP